MSNKGQQFEKTIRLIQETFKDSENTTIFSNYKIPNESGNNREIDILIVSKINDFEIYIAIECKDYNKKIPVEKIEAFQSKCDRIKQINKKIFISSKGFQSDSINSAKYYGIELFTANELTSDALTNLIPIRQIKPQLLPIINNAVLTFETDEDSLKELKENYDGEIYQEGNDLVKNLKDIAFEAVGKKPKDFFGLALFQWMKSKEKNEKEMIFPVSFELTFQNYYYKKSNGEKIKLLKGEFEVLIKFGFIVPELISGRTFKDSKGETKANSVNIKVKENVETEIIIKPNEGLDIYLTENQKTEKLQTLFSYNPETDNITKSK
jgi:hypothetical protein